MDPACSRGRRCSPRHALRPKGKEKPPGLQFRSWGGAGGEATSRKGTWSAVSPALAWQDAGA